MCILKKPLNLHTVKFSTSYLEHIVKHITDVPREFVLSSSYDWAPLHIYGGTGVRCHLEVGHITQRS